MIITCEKCQTRFKVPDEKLAAGPVRMRCSKCNHVFSAPSSTSTLPGTTLPPGTAASQAPTAAPDPFAGLPAKPLAPPAPQPAATLPWGMPAANVAPPASAPPPAANPFGLTPSTAPFGASAGFAPPAPSAFAPPAPKPATPTLTFAAATVSPPTAAPFGLASQPPAASLSLFVPAESGSAWAPAPPTLQPSTTLPFGMPAVDPFAARSPSSSSLTPAPDPFAVARSKSAPPTSTSMSTSTPLAPPVDPFANQATRVSDSPVPADAFRSAADALRENTDPFAILARPPAATPPSTPPTPASSTPPPNDPFAALGKPPPPADFFGASSPSSPSSPVLPAVGARAAGTPSDPFAALGKAPPPPDPFAMPSSQLSSSPSSAPSMLSSGPDPFAGGLSAPAAPAAMAPNPFSPSTPNSDPFGALNMGVGEVPSARTMPPSLPEETDPFAGLSISDNVDDNRAAFFGEAARPSQPPQASPFAEPGLAPSLSQAPTLVPAPTPEPPPPPPVVPWTTRLLPLARVAATAVQVALFVVFVVLAVVWGRGGSFAPLLDLDFAAALGGDERGETLLAQDVRVVRRAIPGADPRGTEDMLVVSGVVFHRGDVPYAGVNVEVRFDDSDAVAARGWAWSEVDAQRSLGKSGAAAFDALVSASTTTPKAPRVVPGDHAPFVVVLRAPAEGTRVRVDAVPAAGTVPVQPTPTAP